MTELLRCNVFTCDSAPLPGSLYCNEHKPAPSAEPERRAWVDGFGWLDVHHLRKSLSRYGWAIVSASDVPSAEERKVLEAMGAARIYEMRPGEWRIGWPADEQAACKAELARRAAKEKP